MSLTGVYEQARPRRLRKEPRHDSSCHPFEMCALPSHPEMVQWSSRPLVARTRRVLPKHRYWSCREERTIRRLMRAEVTVEEQAISLLSHTRVGACFSITMLWRHVGRLVGVGIDPQYGVDQIYQANCYSQVQTFACLYTCTVACLSFESSATWPITRKEISRNLFVTVHMSDT